MMTENQLIKNLQALKQITPKETWVSSVRYNLFGPEQKSSILEILPGLIFQKKLAYAAITICTVLAVVAGISMDLAQNKGIAKQQQAALLAASQSRQSLEVVNKKMEDLAAAVKTNNPAQITSAVKEINESITEASKTITKQIVSNPKALKEIANSVKEVDQNKKDLETLGVMVDSDYQLNNVLQPLVQSEIGSLEKASLNDAQQMTLKEIKGLYQQGQYADALEKLLLMASN